MYPKCIRNVIDCFKNLPGIGEKTAERLAFSLIGFSKENLTSFSAAITDIRDKITTCEICGNIADSNICNICSDKERNSHRKYSSVHLIPDLKDHSCENFLISKN